MKVALQVRPGAVTEDLVQSKVVPLLDKLKWRHITLPIGHDDGIQLDPDVDFLLSLGGDGTFLTGARLAASHGVPILGLMVGRLGFLCASTLEELPQALDQIAAGVMPVTERSILNGRIICENGRIIEDIAVNDVIVHRLGTDNMRELIATHDNQLIARYRGDGIILSTALGSTAYTLAAGGPLVHPELDLLVLTPICAHSLFTKPLVLPPNEKVSIELPEYEPGPVNVSFDGATSMGIAGGDRLEVHSVPDQLKVFLPVDYDFFAVLRDRFQHGYVYGDNDA